MTEIDEHLLFARWVVAHEAIYPCLKLLHHIPNGEKRSVKTAKKLKDMLVRPGVPDFFFPHAAKGFHGMYIELKKEGGRQSIKQKEFQAGLTGFQYVVCDSAKKAVEELKNYFL